MVDDRVGGFRLAQRLTGMTWLAAGLLSQALRAWRLLQPIAGRRLAAVAAVQAKAAFQFRDAACQGVSGRQPVLQHFDLCLLCCDDLLRRRKGGRSSIINWSGLGSRWRQHRELDSCPESPVKPMTDRATWAVTKMRANGTVSNLKLLLHVPLTTCINHGGAFRWHCWPRRSASSTLHTTR